MVIMNILPPLSLFSEIFTTTCISSLAYAVHICIAASTLVVLAKQGNQYPHRVSYGIFVAVLLLLGTINISIHLDSLVYRLRTVAQSDIYEFDWIVRYCFDPRREEYSSDTHLECLTERLREAQRRAPYTRETSVSEPTFDQTRAQEIPALFVSIMAQSYLLLRCHSLWGRRFVTAAMGLLLPVVTVFGVLNIYYLPPDQDIITAAPSYPIFSNGIPKRVLARVYWGLALGYNISANTLIVGRLLWLRAKVTSVMGKEFGKLYTGLAAMIMESSTLYSVVLILGYTVLPLGEGGSGSLFSPLVSQTEAVAAELIILRLALGRALSRREVATVTAAMPDTSGDLDHPDNSDVDGTTSLVRRGRAPRRRTSKAGAVRDAAHSTFSRFPSSVAAVLRSYQGDETESQRSADIIRLEYTRLPEAGTSEPALTAS